MIGGSGYIGTNLIYSLARKEERIIQISRRPVTNVDSLIVDLGAEILPSTHPLFSLKPKVVWYLGRPRVLQFTKYRTYHTNVQNLLIAWCKNTELSAVHFSSTSLVYDGNTMPVSSDDKTRTAPADIYAYFKLETELFLQYLSLDIRKDVSFNSWRLPVVFGGNYKKKSFGFQFIYWFIEQYASGHQWRFEGEHEYIFGTSWVHLPDIIKIWLTENIFDNSTLGFNVKNICSGFFTYFQLHNELTKFYPVFDAKKLMLFKSRFELTSESSLPQIDICSILPKYIEERAKEC